MDTNKNKFPYIITRKPKNSLLLCAGDGEPLPDDPQRTGLVVAYRNKPTIFRDVAPYVQVDGEEFTYSKYDKKAEFTPTDDTVGRKGEINESSWGYTDETAKVVDRALMKSIPQSDIDKAKRLGLPDLLDRAAEKTMQEIELNNEKRCNGFVFNAATYPTDYKEDLAATATKQFNETDADPIGYVADKLLVPDMTPNVILFGEAEWNKFRRLSDVIKAIHGNSGDKGIATRQQVAELFEVEKIIVGRAKINSANKGKTMVKNNIWHSKIALLYVNFQQKTNSDEPGFCFTPRYGSRVSRTEFDAKAGLRGMWINISGESNNTLVCAPEFGFLIQNPFA